MAGFSSLFLDKQFHGSKSDRLPWGQAYRLVKVSNRFVILLHFEESEAAVMKNRRPPWRQAESPRHSPRRLYRNP